MIKSLFLAVLLSIGFGAYSQSLNQIKEDVIFLSSDHLEGRKTGTKGEQLAAEYIANRFLRAGIQAKGIGGYYQGFEFATKAHPHDTANSGPKIAGKNVIAFIDNGAPINIIIGAHYDHLGMGGEGSLHAGEEAIHNGADDNASGVALLLYLAEKLKETNMKHNVVFIAFSGEEMGLWGSNYFSKNPTLDITKTSYMLNFDMVGRLGDEKKLSISGTGTSPVFENSLNGVEEDFEFVYSKSGVGPSDHTSFYLQDIPVLHFFTGQHSDYHKPGDDWHLVNFEGIEQIAMKVMRLIASLDATEKLEFKKTKNDDVKTTPRFKVTLGVMPDYLFSGKGMRIDGVQVGKPASKAGILKGDVVIKMGEVSVYDMHSYMEGLSKFEKGDKTKIIVDRNGEKVKVEVTF